jgi:hypothetical protein
VAGDVFVGHEGNASFGKREAPGLEDRARKALAKLYPAYAAQRKEIADAASQLASPQVVSAANGIVQEARDVCHLDLEL